MDRSGWAKGYLPGAAFATPGPRILHLATLGPIHGCAFLRFGTLVTDPFLTLAAACFARFRRACWAGFRRIARSGC